MTKPIFHPANKTGFIVGTAMLVGLTGCVTDQAGPATGYRGRPSVQVQTSLGFHDDYVYYPGYATYYGQNRREFVYRDGNTWVRRPEPRGVIASVLFASPSVRLDFHDSPEQHDSAVVRAYPRNWAPPGNRPDDRVPQRVEMRNAPGPMVVAQDAYVYYPGYETYYSQNRREYVYRDGNAWVRRPEPRGVPVNVLVGSPSVRLDFHDSPEQHHHTVVQQYPKNWKQEDKKHDAKDDRKADKKDEKKDRHDDRQ